ncbi:MAG: cell division protein FtsA [Candidatus Niyogibacteria bacterium RIFCSPLOWO2_01_FULL_45_48]|uniref:Cell division protein FtsA n=2 Tax=Candidatus Niyogiibacteriota TaxID=1817912 RepID=A0A1G2EZE7_9BACT|nr:MAG: cell division protein FtsA [Candidatus Niyogibacteria bacterium RIFCSPLOWO2_01_FULL_45_48]OGZ31216.1 MAG: cell division protein FtsA [Candidatus Niyogibacteria bacterium RIFCSPLOWO2_02_FULL_45_13]
MARNFVLGVDIGSSGIYSVVGGWDGRAEGLKILGTGFAQSSGIRRGKIIDVGEVSGGIKASVAMAEKKSGLRLKSGVLSIGGTDLSALRSKGLIMVSRASNEISDFDAKRALDQCQSNIEPLTNRDVLHSYPLSFTVDGQFKTLNPVGMAGSKLECEAVFITALSRDIKNAVRAMELADLMTEDVLASPIASARAVLPKRHKEVGSVLIDIGASTSSLAVFEEGLPISLEVLPFGSFNITNDVALGFQISIDEAEEMKKNFPIPAAPSKKRLAEIISARLSDIFELTNKHLKKIERVRLLPAGAVLTGGGSRLAEITAFAKDYLELPAQIGQLEEVRMPDGLEPGPWAVAVGLCLMAHDSAKGQNDYGFEITRKTGGAVLRWLKSLLP